MKSPMRSPLRAETVRVRSPLRNVSPVRTESVQVSEPDLPVLSREPEPRKKNAVLSRIFSKPQSKEQPEEEPRTGRKHKLFSQNLLEETATNSPTPDLLLVENVHQTDSKSVIKSKSSNTKGK